MDVIELTREQLSARLRKRAKESNKGTYGTANAVVGSASYRGAAVLSAMGLLRGGAGIVRVCSTEKVCACVASHYPSATFLPLPENAEGMISSAASDMLMSTVDRGSALLIGCGIGISKDTLNVVNRLVLGAKCPVTVDADGLNALAFSGGIELLKPIDKGHPCYVFTPHPGEMARLCGVSVDDIKGDKPGYASRFSLLHGCVTVLKDSETLIAVPRSDGGCSFYISRFGNAGLARGGSGDVLAGVITSFLAQGYTAEDSAVIGTLIHGISADMCARENSMQGMLPDQLGKYICKLFLELEA